MSELNRGASSKSMRDVMDMEMPLLSEVAEEEELKIAPSVNRVDSKPSQ
jgi:hypothetical protein